MDGTEVLIPLAFFGMIIAIVWVVMAQGARSRVAFHETVRAAIERGEALSPDTIKALGAPRRTRHADIKGGVLLLAIAAAFLVLGAVIHQTDHDPDVLAIMSGIAAFPGFVGLALLGYGIATRREQS